MRALLQPGVLFTLVALVWAPATVAVESPQGISVADTPASRPSAISAQPTRHIVGVTDMPAAQRATAAAQLRVVDIIDLIGAMVVEGPEQAVRGLARAPFVRYVEPDPPDAVWIQANTLPYGVANIEAEVVWGGFAGATTVIPGSGAAGVKVAVIDTGIDCSHPDLAGNCFFGAKYVSGSNNDEHGHGTHVAGIIGARDNGFGVIGVAPEAVLYAVKVLDKNGSGSFSSVANGIVWAIKNKMQVINMSLGGSSGSQALHDAVKAAWDAGILVVSAAGNSGCCDRVLYPAKYPESMAVAAVDESDTRASFSSTGAEVTVAAPGVKILSTVPTGSCALCDKSGYRALSGTSMATPHVAGAAALLLSRGHTAAETWGQLAGTTKDLGYAGWDTLTGWGRIDALAATTQAPYFPPIVDTEPPQVWFVSPPDGTVLSGSTVTVQVEATDDTAIQQIELWRSYTEQTATGWRTVSSRLATSAKSPLSYKWDIRDLTSRTYTLEARAMDSVGYMTITRITVNKP